MSPRCNHSSSSSISTGDSFKTSHTWPSCYATGAVLSQLCKDDKWHPVGFMSKSLSSAERNYEIHDKELLSIIRGLEEWRHILEGTKHTIEILNDHRNLAYFRESQNLNCQ